MSRRLRQRGSDDEEKIKARLEIAEKELEQAKVDGFHDKILINDDLQNTYKRLERYIFGEEDVAVEEAHETLKAVSTEVKMTEDNAVAGENAANDEVNGVAEKMTNDTPAEEETIVVQN